jgi:hypothetical protein
MSRPDEVLGVRRGQVWKRHRDGTLVVVTDLQNGGRLQVAVVGERSRKHWVWADQMRRHYEFVKESA